MTKTAAEFIADLEAALAEHEREASRLRAMIAAAKGEPTLQAQPRPPTAEEVAAALKLLLTPLPGLTPPPWPQPAPFPWVPLVPGTPVYPDGTGPLPFPGTVIIYGSGFVDAGVVGAGVAGGPSGPPITGWCWSGTIDGAPNLATMLAAGGRIPVECSPGWMPPPMPVLPKLSTVGPGQSLPPSDQRYRAS